MFLAGGIDYLPRPGNPYSPDEETPSSLTAPQVFHLVQNLLDQVPWNLPLHPAPPWHHLYTEPILELPLKYNFQFRWTTSVA